MDDFSLSTSIKRRDQELQVRRERLKKLADEAMRKEQEARLKTAEIVESRETAKREKFIKEEMDRLRDEGAPDGGLRYEKIIDVGLSESLKNDSDRVILPQSILSDLSSESLVSFPLMFELFCFSTNRRTHVGVLEFSSEGSSMHVPEKVFRCLGLSVGHESISVRLRYKHLPKCRQMRLRVSEEVVTLFPDFRSYLESHLSQHYVTVTQGDELLVDGQSFLVEDVDPDNFACCLIDADVDLDMHVVGSVGGEKRWSVGSPWTVQFQQRLYLEGGNSNRLKLVCHGDIFVSIPPNTDASMEGYDFSAFSEDSAAGSVLVISLDQLAELGYTTWPPFVTVGSDTLMEISTCWDVGVASFPTSLSDEPTCGVCPNCDRSVPVASLSLHRLRCERDFRRCDVCSRMVRIQESHVHCETCKMACDKHNLSQHESVWHSLVKCLCGAEMQKYLLKSHRATCPASRRSVCRFCGLSFPIGDLSSMDARDRMMGFTSTHEAACGNRTQQCDMCGKWERRKDFELHRMAFHHK